MSSSRDNILKAVAANQPELLPLPQLPQFAAYFDIPLLKFRDVLEGIGATVLSVSGYADIRNHLATHFDLTKPVYSTIAALPEFALRPGSYSRPQDLHNVELIILPAEFGVAENGAVWITDEALPERALPFIPEHLAVVIAEDAILANMHEAYLQIGQRDYGWAAFIAGPSKTADIEQSLVLGAHGPRSMTVFLLKMSGSNPDPS